MSWHLHNTHPAQVPRLSDLCKQILQTNVAYLSDVGDTPYDMLKDILPGCRVEQLREIEEYSPHIAEQDEEIWQRFFIRDFPVVAENRGLVAPQASTSAVPYSAPSIQTGNNSVEPVSFRDLYYDEQIAREERLATAGNRLKERVAALRDLKLSRRVVVDPRLGFDKRRILGVRRPKKVGFFIKRPMPWTQREYKGPKSMMDKARERAGAISAATYTPPKYTRAVASRLDEAISGRPASAAKPPTYAEAFDTTCVPSQCKVRTVVRRIPVPQPVESSISQPFKIDDTGPDVAHEEFPGPRQTRTLPQVRQGDMEATRQSAARNGPGQDSRVPGAKPTKAIPGITRRPISAKHIDKIAHAASAQSPPLYTSCASSPEPGSPPATSSSAQSPPLHLSPPVPANSAPLLPSAASLPPLPMLGKAARPPAPSLFIPRKRPKV